ncbi:MAG: hypothetical protein M1812_006430 [Candelaria pacifica]|nr:MAG: hypothetical protein M1812_006430 [Candelaria pacifica]
MSIVEGGPGSGGRPDLETEAATFHSPQLLSSPGHPSGHEDPVLPHSAHENIMSIEDLTASRAVSMPSIYNTPMIAGTSGSPSNGSQHPAIDSDGSAPVAASDAQEHEELRTQSSETDQEPRYGPFYQFESSSDSLAATGELPTPSSFETSSTPGNPHPFTDHHQPPSAPHPALFAALQARAAEAMADDAALFGINWDDDDFNHDGDDDDLELDPPSQDFLNSETTGHSTLYPTSPFEAPVASGSSFAFDANGFPDFAATQAAWQAQNGEPGIIGLPQDDEYESADISNDYADSDVFGRNSNLYKFIREWSHYYEAGEAGYPPISSRAMMLSPCQRVGTISRENLAGDVRDIQGIDWHCLETTRRNARRARSAIFRKYPNPQKAIGSEWARSIPNSENYFQFRLFDLSQRPRLMHFQLRHNLSVSSGHDVLYAGFSKVLRAGSCGSGSREQMNRCVMDVSQPGIESVIPGGGINICSLSATHGVLIAGGFRGEYAMKDLSSDCSASHTEGVITNHKENGITNHIHTLLSRSNSHPQAVFCSNDNYVRTLDCYTDTIVKEHAYPWPVNCAATSPDGRLRVVVGDTRSVMIDDAESGARLVKLGGHQDFGFSCAWADDGRTIATANQDMQVMIYDARWWQRPLAVIWAEQAGVRSLHFSPVGGGKRVLLMAEPADIISVVDAESFESKQTFDMFGEITGTGFSPDGSKFFVANADFLVGGVAEFERTGHGEEYGVRHLHQQETEDSEDEYIQEKEYDWISDDKLLHDKRVVQGMTTRRRRGVGLCELSL